MIKYIYIISSNIELNKCNTFLQYFSSYLTEIINGKYNLSKTTKLKFNA